MGKELCSDIPGLEFSAALEAAASGATNTTVENGYFVAPFALKLKGAYLAMEEAATGAATNYFKVALINRSNTDAEMAAITFNATSVTCAAKGSVAMTVSATAASLLASKGDVITLNTTQAGTGKVYPKMHPILYFERQ